MEGMPELPEVKSEAECPTEAVKKAANKSSSFRGVTLFRTTMKWRAQVDYQSIFTIYDFF